MSEDTISTNNRSRSRVDSSWQDPDRVHQLVKTEGGWECQCCYRSWLKKPRAKCLGLPVVPGAAKVVNWQDAISIDTALRSNLQLKQLTKPIAAGRDPLGDPNCDLLFARTEFEECEPNFYRIVSWVKNYRPGLKTLLVKFNFCLIMSVELKVCWFRSAFFLVLAKVVNLVS
jgi:hypothetical protein